MRLYLTPKGITVIEVTKDFQMKRGNRIFSVDTVLGEVLYGVYDSGMIRALPSEGNSIYTCYQLNPVRKVVRKSYFTEEDANGVETWRSLRHTYNTTERIPIFAELQRIEFLFDYLDRKYVKKLVVRNQKYKRVWT